MRLLCRTSSVENVEPVQKNLDVLSKRFRDLIRDLLELDFDHEDRGHLEGVSVWEVLAQAMDLLKQSFESKKLSISFVKPDFPLILYEKEQDVFQMFYNVLLNSCESIGPLGGQISIVVDHGGGYIDILIQDTGCGIPEAKLATLFVNGTFGKPGGSGYGLKIVKQLANRLGGEVSVKSVREQGTQFLFRFPKRLS